MLNRNFVDIVVATIKSVSPIVQLLDGTWYTGNNIANFLQGLRNFTAVKVSAQTSTTQFSTFIIGRGNSENLYDEYNLADRLDETDFEITSSNFSLNSADTHNRKLLFTQTWQYNGTDTIQIKEFGLVDNEGYYGNHIHLVDRVVLASPITLTNGASFIISLEIGGKGSITLV